MRLVLKSKHGYIYRLTDPEASVTPDEWARVCNLIERLLDLAIKEDIDVGELLMCMNEQVGEAG